MVINFLNKNYNIKNLNFSILFYKKVPEVLSKYKIALMPYNDSEGRLKNTNLVNYMSPLKMFDYLAVKDNFTSNLKVYKHVLKNKFNSILIKNNDDDWKYWINKIFTSSSKFEYLKKNARKTVRILSRKDQKKLLISQKKFFFNSYKLYNIL